MNEFDDRGFSRTMMGLGSKEDIRVAENAYNGKSIATKSTKEFTSIPKNSTMKSLLKTDKDGASSE